MATFNVTPGQSWVQINTTAQGPIYIELQAQGKLRVHVSNGTPDDEVGTFHKLTYPGGTFSYAGSEKLWVRNDAAAGVITVVYTEVL